MQAILSDAFHFTFNFTPVLTEMLKGLFKELPIDNEPGTESVNIFFLIFWKHFAVNIIWIPRNILLIYNTL